VKVLVVDNYDSFTHTLVGYLHDLGVGDLTVLRNDEVSGPEALKYDAVLLSPGPGLPHEAGNLMEVIGSVVQHKSVLGICLGHQALAMHFGAKLVPALPIQHGYKDELVLVEEGEAKIDGGLDKNILSGIPNRSAIARYHSWTVEENKESGLLVTARNHTGMVMAFEHKSLRVWGLQFHPESILTDHGHVYLDNWLRLSR